MTKHYRFNLGAPEARLVKHLATHWKLTERDVLRLAVWAYVKPLVPDLPPPIDGPLPTPPPPPTRRSRANG